MFYAIVIVFVLLSFINLPKCYCGNFKGLQERRLNTSYYDDERNWLYSCKLCFDEQWAYYKERWEDYYADVRVY
jgi:hypothetical protein